MSLLFHWFLLPFHWFLLLFHWFLSLVHWFGCCFIDFYCNFIDFYCYSHWFSLLLPRSMQVASLQALRRKMSRLAHTTFVKLSLRHPGPAAAPRLPWPMQGAPSDYCYFIDLYLYFIDFDCHFIISLSFRSAPFTWCVQGARF